MSTGRKRAAGARVKGRTSVPRGSGARAAGAAPPTGPRRATRKAATDAGDGQNLLVVYVHGIGNKPRESVLECQWDNALFNVNMGDRTRTAYWVNRTRYPIPDPGECSGADRIDAGLTGTRSLALGAGTPGDTEAEIRAITDDESARKALRGIARQMSRSRGDFDAESRRVGKREVREKVLPLPAPARGLLARLTTGLLLKDVHDFLFDDAERNRMCGVLEQRLTPGGGPFVVVAHSQGTMIAYRTLLDLAARRPDLHVPLLVTMGSPLGMQEVVDRFRTWTGVRRGRLPAPSCVGRWINVADRFDVVAIDNQLAHDYAISDPGLNEKHGFGVNPDFMRDPHSATGYLSTDFVRTAVKDAVGPGFAQSVRSFVVARDLHADLADLEDERHAVLIEVQSPKGGDLRGPKAGEPDRKITVGERRDQLADRIRRLAPRGLTDHDLDLELLDRFVSVRLNRSEVETLQAEYHDLRIEKIWRNGIKRKLIYESVKTIQASTAQLGYGALGNDVDWAVLDTGVRHDHPHFLEHRNIVSEWNCTARGALAPAAAGTHPAADGDGHGTHVCGIIAGRFPRALKSREWPSAPPVSLCGMAPQARLHVYKVLDDQGVGRDSWIIKALDHIARTNEEAGHLVIHGLNLSLGSSYDPEVFGCGHTPLCEELRRLWRQGVIVCVAAGNEGYAILRSSGGDVEANMDLTIGDPANLDDCIAVGSVHKTNPHTYGVSFFSSRGPTADGRAKPDVVAPGERVISAGHRFHARPPAEECLEDYFVEMGGTSMACPHVSGLLAAFLSARREFVGYPDRVKQILLTHCTDLDRDPYIQGRGLPNLTKMLLNT